MLDLTFKDRVEEVVRNIPAGRVMTYGQIAALCGNARAARIVGGVAHFGDSALPWHRVVNKRGGLASGYPGGRKMHAKILANEGVITDDNFYIINVQSHVWIPNE